MFLLIKQAFRVMTSQRYISGNYTMGILKQFSWIETVFVSNKVKAKSIGSLKISSLNCVKIYERLGFFFLVVHCLFYEISIFKIPIQSKMKIVPCDGEREIVVMNCGGKIQHLLSVWVEQQSRKPGGSSWIFVVVYLSYTCITHNPFCSIVSILQTHDCDKSACCFLIQYIAFPNYPAMRCF